MFIDKILENAMEYNASDIHIIPNEAPKMRVYGEILDMNIDEITNTENLLLEIMNEYNIDSYNKRGSSDFAYENEKCGRFRVNVFKRRGKMAATFRIISTEIPKPEKLGYPKQLLDLCSKKRGIVLVTGPTGSGKSTTLASFIDYINMNYRRHIVTLEDPIEYVHKNCKSIVNQREVGLDTLDFQLGLRDALREDPDVILVGEMRDLETTRTAITAAESGHLVFATLHTMGAAETIDRIIDQFPTSQQQYIKVQLASVIEAVISQQLIPNIEGNGRVAAFEIMYDMPAIKNLIREGKIFQITSYMQNNRNLGMQTLDDCLYNLYNEGKITVDNCIAFAKDVITIKNRLNLLN